MIFRRLRCAFARALGPLGFAALATGLALALSRGDPGARAATPAVADADAARQVLVLLRLPPDHYHPGGAYTDSYGDGAGIAARQRVAQRIAAAHGLKLVTNWPIPLVGVDCFVMSVPAGQSPEQVALILARDPDVAGAQPMHVYRTQASAATPGRLTVSAGRETARDELAAEVRHNDPLYLAQPAAREWRLAELHTVATGRNVKVAVIDSMVDITQPDLVGQIQTRQDFVLDHPRAAEQHGTGVAGIIAAVADNHVGIAGVAPRARLMALRACWQEGSAGAVCDTLSLAKALYFAIGHNAQVINLSLSGPTDPLLGRLIDVALARGMVVVGALDPNVADGGFPASHAGVVAVSDDPATTAPGALVAPGREAPTTQPGGRFAFVSGSSYAAAHVSGLFALMRERSGKAVTPVSLVTFKPGGGAIDTCASLMRAAGAACPRSGGTSTVARE
ncbi:MAG: S8 family peptidase [Phenylobacterium sp.]